MPEIEGFPDNPIVFRSMVDLGNNTKGAIRASFFEIGKDLVATFNKQVLAKNKRGRLYIRVNRAGARRRHRASAPGQSPANRTGFYRKSVGFLNQTTQLVFGDSAPYAGHLEVGTLHMKARPGLGNAIASNERNIMRDFNDGIIRKL